MERRGTTGSSGFDGSVGRLAARVMALLNADMERFAIDDLAPAPDHRVLSVGFGPGLGVAALARRLARGRVAGVDPSGAMVEVATRRNRVAVGTGRVELRRAGAEALPWPDGDFDAVLAVNSIQLWPLDAGIAEVARVLRPQGALVSVTHVWALEKQMALARWTANAVELLSTRGFDSMAWRTEAFRSGRGLVLRARRTGPAGAGGTRRGAVGEGPGGTRWYGDARVREGGPPRPDSSVMPSWLTDTEFQTLCAACARLIPADETPGAVEAGAPQYIDGLLGAFLVDPPRIWAGGPSSGRFGGPAGFARFHRLPPLDELAWRMRIEGSRGMPEREFNGPVVGWQEMYRQGLAGLGEDFGALSGEDQDARLRAAGEFTTLLYKHCCEGMYGAPEYGGNRHGAAWRAIDFPGDVQPRGYTDAEVSEP